MCESMKLWPLVPDHRCLVSLSHKMWLSLAHQPPHIQDKSSPKSSSEWNLWLKHVSWRPQPIPIFIAPGKWKQLWGPWGMQPGMNTTKAHYYTRRLLDQGTKRKQVSVILSTPPPPPLLLFSSVFDECCNFPAHDPPEITSEVWWFSLARS